LDEREDRAWRGLMAMHEGLAEFLERQLRSRCGLSNADFQVLAHLSEASEGRLRSFELTGLLRWEKSRLSQHLGRMQTRGLVLRERCSDDRRGAVVAITARGTELIEAAAPQHLADVRSAFIDQVTAAELATLTPSPTRCARDWTSWNQAREPSELRRWPPERLGPAIRVPLTHPEWARTIVQWPRDSSNVSLVLLRSCRVAPRVGVVGRRRGDAAGSRWSLRPRGGRGALVLAR
jgi:DNA-binding MarR family transcriptional regulator